MSSSFQEFIAKALPVDWVVFVKVHPHSCLEKEKFAESGRSSRVQVSFFLSRMRVAFITHSFFTGAPGFSQYFVALSETLERDPDWETCCTDGDGFHYSTGLQLAENLFSSKSHGLAVSIRLDAADVMGRGSAQNLHEMFQGALELGHHCNNSCSVLAFGVILVLFCHRK